MIFVSEIVSIIKFWIWDCRWMLWCEKSIVVGLVWRVCGKIGL